MPKLYVAVLWHQHQPNYMDPDTGHFAMPWVRLHAIKDYIGMANLAAEFPAVRQCFNYVPSLLQQIQQYLAGETDLAMIVSRVPADSLSAANIAYILDNFFMAQWDRMVNPYPRYRQLLVKRDFGRKTATDAAKKFTVDDLRDLQVWSNLAWFHPTVLEKDAELRALIAKDRGFTEEEKHFVLDRQLAVMAEVIPLHRRLMEAGLIEVTTTPFYHPILPLLCDASKARVAIPGLPLPEPMVKAPEDAAAQIEKAAAFHERVFGVRPRGSWPSEGSVSDDVTPLFARAGINWIATDEEILGCTLRTHFTRDAHGMVDQPERLYRPYRVRTANGPLHLVFRDHAISDAVGFRYYLQRSRDAAADLMARLAAIRDRAPNNALVLIALDGENCWEHYENQGADFLRRFYQLLGETPGIETIRVDDYLRQFDHAQELTGVFPGSWIGHNFATWVGHWEKNRAWEHLARARAAYEARANALPPEQKAAVLEEIYVAEGSDWFWWYGDDHSSGNDAEFDSLFRKHVRQIYQLLGLEPPIELYQPIIRTAERDFWRPPRGFLDVKVDGQRTSFFEWLGAGVYEQHLDSGAMQRAEAPPVAALYFGFSTQKLFLRLDGDDPSWKRHPDVTVELWIGNEEQPAFSVHFTPESVEAELHGKAGQVEAARKRVIEIAVPLSVAGLAPGTGENFHVRILDAGQPVQRIPGAGTMRMSVPSDAHSGYPSGEDLV